MLNRSLVFVTLLASLGVAPAAVAQAPAGATAKCKDGSYTDATSHRGACRGHGGVDQWLAAGAGKSAKSEAKGKDTGKAATPAAAPTTAAAAAPSGPPPAEATAKCKDGSYWTNPSHRGACKKHGGVDQWLAANASASKASAASAAAPAAPAPPAAAPAPSASSKAAAAPAAPPKPTAAATAAPAPGNAPADATAQCKDGTYSHAQHHRGACAGHGGVQQWLKDVPK
jgi:hypothetical protein